MPVKSKAKTKSKAAAESKPEQPLSIKWPPLTPALPASELSIEETLKDQILVVPSLFTYNLCKTLVSLLATLPLSTTPGKPKRGEATRVNDRLQIYDAPFAQHLWEETALKDLILNYPEKEVWGGDVLGLNSNIRIYRYTPGQFFDQHIDESNRVIGPNHEAARTTWTLLIYLTICEGGETAFYPEPPSRKDPAPEPILVSPQVGSALLHRHYPECLLHEGKEVLSGEKWIIRSDLIVKR